MIPHPITAYNDAPTCGSPEIVEGLLMPLPARSWSP